ncbi:MAG: response regulator [Thermodesulfovibrionales bacterium]|jgi:response regulator RpfG family c-di-GMP phosphodiesterase|nr:response regulator [Thermodesulfovibrionales bacterium]
MDEKVNVLFVDDEENVLRSMKRLFMDVDSINILTAPSGKEGLGMLKNNEVAVIVSDQKMPEMSGAEFLEKARRMQPESVRIVLTGYADINAAMDAVNKGGASKYITKPWNDNDLMLTVLNSVETYNLKKENKRLTELTRKQNEELKKWSSELEFYVQQQTVDLTKQNKQLTTLNEKLRKNFRDFISAFYNLLELRNKIIYIHSNNVATIVSEMVHKMGLSYEESENTVVAAQLHDIGKIGIPDAMLIKNFTEFSAEEKEEYIKHPVIGQAVIDSVEGLRDAGVLIRHHHEWYNGNGFPDRLRYEKIPLGSRVIAMADKFDRLTNIGRDSLNIESALQKIKAILGTQLDPDLYQFLSKAVHEGTIAAIPETENVEVELKPNDLVPGIVLSRDVRSGTGLLLLRKGTTLNEKNIETLKRGYHLDPSKSGIFVWGRKT